MSHPITVLPTPRKPPALDTSDGPDEPGTIVIADADWTPAQSVPAAPSVDWAKLACWVVAGASCVAALLGIVCLVVAAASALGGLLVHLAAWGL